MSKEQFGRVFKLFFLGFLAVLLNGCATAAQYQKVTNSWIGKNEDVLIDTWGYPNHQFIDPRKNLVYIYHKSRTLVFSQTYSNNPEYFDYYGTNIVTPYGTQTSSKIEKLSCTTWFVINKKSGIIKKVLFRGDYCKAGGMGGDSPSPPPKTKPSNSSGQIPKKQMTMTYDIK